MWKSILKYALSAALGMILSSPLCVYLLDMSWIDAIKAGVWGAIGGLSVVVYYQRKAKREKEKDKDDCK